LVKACLNNMPQTEIHRLAELAENRLLPAQDPETKYSQGTVLAACGEKEIAFTFLRRAVAENYCAHQALLSDPLLAAFARMPSSARLCRQPRRANRNLRLHKA